MSSNESKTSNENPVWLLKWIPVLSSALGGGALWYSWLLYHEMALSGLAWHGLIKAVFMAGAGILCLAAAVLFLAGRSSGWSVLKGGLSLIPIMLMTNLMILLIRGVLALVQGEAQPFWDRLFSEPKHLIIPVIVVAFALLGVLNKRSNPNNSQ
ncbi:hypothetical protein ACFQ88_30855 [Paenibacillus sp. NPDC056579]|uniref:hypothetical protein n=1 Tax=Paenibacillus sp. NPDC056579 TaxID=3345871 RepID=UPI0036BCE472